MQDFWGQPQDRGATSVPSKKTDKKLLPTIGGKIVSIDQEEPWGDEHDYLFAALDFGNALIALSRHAATASILMPSITLPICRRRIITPPSIAGWQLRSRKGAGARMRLCTWANMAHSSGSRAKASACQASAIRICCSATCRLIYPFIINDPGEGSQSKRRAHAVIVDHLTPPMTYGRNLRRIGRTESTRQ